MGAERALSYIGIAKKAGKLVTGTPSVCGGMKRGSRYPVFAACDISEGTKKRLSDRCAYYGVRLVTLPAGGEALARMSGKTGFVAAVSVTDAGLSEAAVSALEAENV